MKPIRSAPRPANLRPTLKSVTTARLRPDSPSSACERPSASELETAKNQHARLNGEAGSKSEALQRAGIDRATANRYEQLSGPREEQAKRVVAGATGSYFANLLKEHGGSRACEDGSASHRWAADENRPTRPGRYFNLAARLAGCCAGRGAFDYFAVFSAVTIVGVRSRLVGIDLRDCERRDAEITVAGCVGVLPLEIAFVALAVEL